MSKKNVYRPGQISGFPEWLPEERLVELKWIDYIRSKFESYGYCSIETPAIEELAVLLAKGETDKEIFVLNRLHSDDDKDVRNGLHYDLTVPFARYVAQHFDKLTFPFKRFQIQKVWRGERPQVGRYREFYQCDIDVINQSKVPISYDVELLEIAVEILTHLKVGTFQFHISNRKILQGYLEGLGIADTLLAIRIIDKLDKIFEDGVRQELQKQLGISGELAEKCIQIAQIKTRDTSFVSQVQALGVHSDLMVEGLEELKCVMNNLGESSANTVVVDLSIARGFDYYTGTIYECKLVDYPDLGSICSGGRYANLTGSFINKSLPGVGISIGLTRIFGKLLSEGKIEAGASSPTHVLVVLPNEDQKELAKEASRKLRNRGLNVELYDSPDKIGRQLQYASRKKIPFVWFPPFDELGKHEVKNMTTGEQTLANPDEWCIYDNE